MRHNCKAAREQLWDLDNGIDLAGCEECQLELRRLRALSAGLRHLPVQQAPPLPSTRLLVLASHAKQGPAPGRLSGLLTRLRLAVDNVLRPLAVPAAGGLMASVLCFTTIVDTLAFPPMLAGADMPVALFTEVKLTDASPFGCNGTDVVVQLTVDSHGRVTDYTLPRGKATAAQMQEIGNLVLYSTFTPATSFGQRVSSKVLVDIHHMNVRD